MKRILLTAILAAWCGIAWGDVAVFPATDAKTGEVSTFGTDAWATYRDATTGTATALETRASTAFYSGMYYIYRGFLTFDTSALLETASIDSAKIVANVQSKLATGGNLYTQFILGTQTTMDTGIYNDFVGWAASGVYTVTIIADSVSTATYANNDTLRTKLNAAGLSNISNSGNTTFAMLMDVDIHDIGATAGSSIGYILSDDSIYLQVWGTNLLPSIEKPSRSILCKDGITTPLCMEGYVTPMKRP